MWSYVGFAPVSHGSGDTQHVGPISQRGATHHRHVLTWLACLVAGQHPTFGQHFIAAEERGHGLWGAAIHTAHKLHRTCFRLLCDDRPYHDSVPQDDFPRWRAYWLAYRHHRRQPQRYPHPGAWRATAP
ncbi:MAG: transposase [Anaerolineae bacterium]|nr:transposase [Anaerolineae bacterium]